MGRKGVDPRHFDLWIDRAVQEPAELADVRRPFPADAMLAYTVNSWVNDARHDDVRCLEPVLCYSAPPAGFCLTGSSADGELRWRG